MRASGRASSSGTARSRARARRCLGLDDPRLLPTAPRRAPVRCGNRSGLPRPRRVAGPRSPGRGVHVRARGVLRGRRARPRAAPRHLRRRRPPPHARRGLRDAPFGGSRSRSRASPRAASPSASTVSESRPNASSPTPRRPSCSAMRPQAALDLLPASTLPERLLSLGELEVRGPRAASFAEARDATVAAALDQLAARDRELRQKLLHDLRGRIRGREGPRVRARLRDLQLRARDLLREPPGDQGARAGAVPLDHGRRVPGHEPSADGAPGPARADRRRRPLRGRRRVPVDRRVPTRRRGGVP